MKVCLLTLMLVFLCSNPLIGKDEKDSMQIAQQNQIDSLRQELIKLNDQLYSMSIDVTANKIAKDYFGNQMTAVTALFTIITGLFVGIGTYINSKRVDERIESKVQSETKRLEGIYTKAVNDVDTLKSSLGGLAADTARAMHFIAAGKQEYWVAFAWSIEVLSNIPEGRFESWVHIAEAMLGTMPQYPKRDPMEPDEFNKMMERIILRKEAEVHIDRLKAIKKGYNELYYRIPEA